MTGPVAGNILRDVTALGATGRSSEAGRAIGPGEARALIANIAENFTRSETMAALTELAGIHPDSARGGLTDADIARLRTTAEGTRVGSTPLESGFYTPERPSVRLPERPGPGDLSGIARTTFSSEYDRARTALTERFNAASAAFDAAVARGETGATEAAAMRAAARDMRELDTAATHLSDARNVPGADYSRQAERLRAAVTSATTPASGS